ncbi:MAG: hypothetical protein ACPLKP_00200 [Microgenomates group bacterium]
MKAQSAKLKAQNLKKFIPPPPPPFETLQQPKNPIEEPFFPSSAVSSPEADSQAQKLAEMKKADEEKSRQLAKKIIEELEQEIAKWRKIREEQLKARRQPPEQQGSQEKMEGEEKQNQLPPLQEPTTKPKRGLFFGFWGRRIKSAQQQSQPEKVGRRVGG